MKLLSRSYLGLLMSTLLLSTSSLALPALDNKQTVASSSGEISDLVMERLETSNPTLFYNTKAVLNTISDFKNEVNELVGNVKDIQEKLILERWVQENLIQEELPTDSDGAISDDAIPSILRRQERDDEDRFKILTNFLNGANDILEVKITEMEVPTTQKEKLGFTIPFSKEEAIHYYDPKLTEFLTELFTTFTDCLFAELPLKTDEDLESWIKKLEKLKYFKQTAFTFLRIPPAPKPIPSFVSSE